MTAAASALAPNFDRVAFARRILHAEADALHGVADRIGEPFDRAVARLLACRGRIAVVGVGKSADVGQKIVGTLNSTGTRAYLLDATRAIHGDLGMVAPDDIVLLLSHSGESEELLRLVGPLRTFAAGLVAVTGNANSSLAGAVDSAIVYGPIREACPMSLAPSTSTTVMLALGDAISFCLSEERQFGPTDFARFHPGGSLGRTLMTVDALMRRGDDLRLAPAASSVRQVFAQVRHNGRRTGAVMLTDSIGSLEGLFTDSDLARLFESQTDGAFDGPIRAVMTRTPLTVGPTAKLVEAVELMRSKKISELPVVDAEGRPVGLLDITDVIGIEPAASVVGSRPPLRLFARPAE